VRGFVDRVAANGGLELSFAEKINTAWQHSIDSIFEVGGLLKAAKTELPHGAFQNMVTSRCPFGLRTAQTLMSVASHPTLSKAQFVAHLPSSWGTLAELARFNPQELDHAIESDWVNPEITRSKARQILFRTRKALGTALSVPTTRPARKVATLQRPSVSFIAVLERALIDDLEEIDRLRIRERRILLDEIRDLVASRLAEFRAGTEP